VEATREQFTLSETYVTYIAGKHGVNRKPVHRSDATAGGNTEG